MASLRLERLSGIFDRGPINFGSSIPLSGYRLPKRRGFISLAVKNLFDEEFEFQDTDLGKSINPSRAFDHWQAHAGVLTGFVCTGSETVRHKPREEKCS